MKGLCIAIAIAAFAVGASLFPQHIYPVIQWINNQGPLAPLVFLFLYCLATLFFLPTMVLTLAGGALFGPVFGTLINLLGATIGAALAFLISRYWFCDWLAAKQNANIHKLIKGVEKRGWQFVALLRVVPVIPFNLVNYGLGLTRIKFSHYLITSTIFLIPVEILSTYCGYAGVEFFISTGLLYKQTIMLLLLILLLSFIAARLICDSNGFSQKLLGLAERTKALKRARNLFNRI